MMGLGFGMLDDVEASPYSFCKDPILYMNALKHTIFAGIQF